MVNTGKPSPGCFACRKRRIKCDTTRPECRKCRKRGWKCPGYRDLNALRIVDETEKQFTRFSGDKVARDEDEAGIGSSASANGALIRQYMPGAAAAGEERGGGGGRGEKRMTPKRSATAASSYPSPVSQASSSPNYPPRSPPTMTTMMMMCRYAEDNDSITSSSSSSSSIPPCVGTSIGEHVYSYFIQNFVQGRALRDHGYLDFLFPLLARNPAGQRDNPLPLAFTATAIISFAARQKVPELLPRAEKIYLRALEATFAAIADESRARDNSTLACVTLLTTFEQMRPSRPSHRQAEAFGSHLDGAMALLKTRGRDVFETVVGRKIFLIIRSLLVTRSICYATPLEPALYALTDAFPQDPTQQRFAQLSLRAADLRVAVERLLGGWGPSHPDTDRAPTRAKVQSLLAEADALEADYDAHMRSLPLAWKVMTLRYNTSRDPAIMGGAVRYVGRVDAYIDMFVCYILNWARAARLYTQNAALRCRAWLLGPERDYRETEAHAYAAGLCQAIIDDVVASVPYVFGETRCPGYQEVSASSSPPSPSLGGRYQPPSLAGVFCVWPVFAASSSDYATDAQRTFLKNVLRYIAEEMGIGQAAILSGYNLRTPSMPIAFTKMKQFEAQGKQLHGVAAGAAAGSVMSSGIKEVMRTTGTVIKTPPDHNPRIVPVGIFKIEDDDDIFPSFDLPRQYPR